MTSYETIYKKFLSKITDYSFAKIPEEDLLEMLRGYLESAVIDFIEPKSDLTQRDDELQTFLVDLEVYEQEVLARYMVSAWLQPMITSTTNTLQAFSKKEGYSQAEFLKGLLALQQDNDVRIKKLLRDKSYVSNSYFDD